MVTFYIVDDDPTVRKILRNILEGEKLGNIVGEAADGEQALFDILLREPEVIIIDLLLPGLDGVALVEALKKEGCRAILVMLSQVTDKEMVEQAYKSGIRFFINKPINRVEILSVLRSILETLSLRQTLERVRRLVDKPSSERTLDQMTLDEAINYIFSNLGILGDSGAQDISIIIRSLHQLGLSRAREQLRNLSNLYQAIRNEKLMASRRLEGSATLNRSAAAKIVEDRSLEEKAIEQRIRRAIAAALQNLAALGLEQPDNGIFKHYANRFFEFVEVRNEMRFLKGETPYHGKISIRRFLEALLLEVDSYIEGNS